jgi:hypothetical protein
MTDNLRVYNYDHFRIVVDNDRGTFSVHYSSYVLDWRYMPASVALAVNQAISDFRKRGLRYI